MLGCGAESRVHGRLCHGAPAGNTAPAGRTCCAAPGFALPMVLRQVGAGAQQARDAAQGGRLTAP